MRRYTERAGELGVTEQQEWRGREKERCVCVFVCDRQRRSHMLTSLETEGDREGESGGGGGRE